MSTTPNTPSSTGSVSIITKNPDGSVTTVTATLANIQTTTTAAVPPPPQEPALPPNKVNLDNISSWKGEWDDSTPGSTTAVTGTSAFVTSGGRKFTVNSTVKGGGFRFSCHAVNSPVTSKNFVYEVTAAFNWSQVTRWELDINMVPDAVRVFMLCTQMEAVSPNGTGYWDLTYSNTPSSWNKSSVLAAMSKWKDGETHTVRVHSSVDWTTGTVTYIGVTIDGVYTPFTGNNVGLSVKNLAWKSAVGLIIPNFQFEVLAGSLTGNASINIYHG